MIVFSLFSQVVRGVLVEKGQTSDSERLHSNPGSATFLLTLEELPNLLQTQFPLLTNRKYQAVRVGVLGNERSSI